MIFRESCKTGLILIIALLFGSCVHSIKPEAKGLQQGHDLKVTIDGKRSVPLTSTVFRNVDFFNRVSHAALWQIESPVSGNPGFYYEIDREVLGEFSSARVIIEKTGSEKVHWEHFYSNLSSPSEEFEPRYTVKAEDFIRGEDATGLASLPPGIYLMRIYVYGSKNWDSQAIFVEVAG